MVTVQWRGKNGGESDCRDGGEQIYDYTTQVCAVEKVNYPSAQECTYAALAQIRTSQVRPLAQCFSALMA